MLLQEKHHKQTTKKKENLDLKMAQLIASALRADYGDKNSSIKMISKHVDASLSTIKKWYGGHNPPNSKHLIMLARSSPSILQVLMTLIEKPELWQLYQSQLLAVNQQETCDTKTSSSDIYTAENCGINLVVAANMISKLNVRQLWFLEYVQKGVKVKAKDIIREYGVSLRTAQDDIVKLTKLRLIRFVGAKKTGRYWV
jgi:transposase